MTQKLALLVWSVSADAPDLCAAPFVYAMAAAALDAEVEVHFAGPAVRLLVEGVAENAVTSGDKPVYSFMCEASSLGISFFACSMAMRQHVAADATMIPEFTGKAGAVTFAAHILDPAWRVLVF